MNKYYCITFLLPYSISLFSMHDNDSVPIVNNFVYNSSSVQIDTALFDYTSHDQIVTLWNHPNSKLPQLILSCHKNRLLLLSYNEYILLWDTQKSRPVDILKNNTLIHPIDYYRNLLISSEDNKASKHIHSVVHKNSFSFEKTKYAPSFSDNNCYSHTKNILPVNRTKGIDSQPIQQPPDINKENIKTIINDTANQHTNDHQEIYRCMIEKTLLTCLSSISALLLLLYCYH